MEVVLFLKLIFGWSILVLIGWFNSSFSRVHGFLGSIAFRLRFLRRIFPFDTNSAPGSTDLRLQTGLYYLLFLHSSSGACVSNDRLRHHVDKVLSGQFGRAGTAELLRE